MRLRGYLPAGEVQAGEVVERLARVRLAPFAETTVAAGQRLADRLFADPALGRDPAVASLAFWLRRANSTRLAQALVAATPVGAVRVPRGLAFHVAPANVEPMFVYSWWLSLLCGNPTVIRLPSRAGALAQALVGHMDAALDEVTRMATAIVGYGHDDVVNRMFSAAAGLRVVWGGDATVAAFRAVPLPAGAAEVAFPDRQSLAALSAEAYVGLGEAGREDVAARLLADITAFGQMACSSPRLLVWVGPKQQAEMAAADLRARLRARAAAATAEPSGQMAKMTEAARLTLDGLAERADTAGRLGFVRLADNCAALPDLRCGDGFLLELVVPELSAIAALTDHRHQTLAHWGFDRAALERLVQQRSGPGLDRLVPVGRALDFSHVWDGQDLLTAFTRAVAID